MSDSWISWNPRIDEPSKPWPSSNVALAQHPGRDGDVLHDAGEVAEAEVDELDALRLDHGQDFGRVPISHVIPPDGCEAWQQPSLLAAPGSPVAISRPLPVCERRMNWSPHPGRSGARSAKTGRMERQQDYVLRSVEERGVRLIRLWFTDVLGQLKSFAISPAELENALEEGMTFDGSSIDGFSRVQESDVLARPDANSFELLPWADPHAPEARMFCDIFNLDGTPFEGDPRQVLRRNLDRARERGLHASTWPRRWSSSTSAQATTAGPSPLDTGSLLRPDHGRRRRHPAQAHDPDAGGHGHPGRVLLPRGLAEPARDRPPPHRRPHAWPTA